MEDQSKSAPEQLAHDMMRKAHIGTGLSEIQTDRLEKTMKGSEISGGVYIGTKIIRAQPMPEAAFLHHVKGKSEEEIRQQETQGDGYKVTYEDGYVSWSPKRIFEQCYRPVSNNEIDLILK